MKAYIKKFNTIPRGRYCNDVDWLRKCLGDDNDNNNNNNNNKNVSDGNTNGSVIVADLKKQYIKNLMRYHEVDIVMMLIG